MTIAWALLALAALVSMALGLLAIYVALGAVQAARSRGCGQCQRRLDIPCICGEPCLSPDCPARERRTPG